MSDEDMAKVRVTKNVVVKPNATSTVLYRQGWEGTAPRAHIEQIVASGSGESVSEGQAEQRPAINASVGSPNQ